MHILFFALTIHSQLDYFQLVFEEKCILLMQMSSANKEFHLFI